MGATPPRVKGRFSAAKVLLVVVVLLAVGVLAVVLRRTIRVRPGAAPIATSGAGLRIEIVPRDGEHVRDLKRSILVQFSRPVARDDFSFAIVPDPGGWTVEADEDGREATLKHANPFRGGTGYSLEARVRSAGARAAVRFTAWGPSAPELIDAAAARGVLDLDTAWTYRLQALFEPGLLPGEYRSPTPIKCGSEVMKGFQGVRSRLRPETLAKLRPYLVRPDHPDSVFTRRLAAERTALWRHAPLSGVAYADAPPRPQPGNQRKQRPDKWPGSECWGGLPFGTEITVWAPCSHGEAKVREVIQFLQSTDMYGRFRTLLDTEPVSDQAMKDDDGKPDNGADGSLDVYLVPASKLSPDGTTMGLCHFIDIRRGITPVWILIDESLSGAQLGGTLAHELFHAFQAAINADAPRWWMEGSATWAEDFTDHGWNTEQDYVPDAFLHDLHMLEGLTSERGQHPYGAYLFPFHLSSHFSDDLIGTIWKACADKDPLDAVDSNVQGGLDDTFKKFAKLNYDDVDSSDHYRETLYVFNRHGAERSVLTSEKNAKDIHIILGPLSALYALFYNKCDERLTPQIRFNLEEFAKNKKLSVQAIVYSGVNKKEEDWTGLDHRVFCLTDENDTFDSLALVLASSEREAVANPTLKIEFKEDVCVPHGGTGEYHGTVVKTWDSLIRKGKQTEEFSGHMMFDPWVDLHRPLTGTATVSRKETLDTWEGPFPPNTQKEYHLTEAGAGTVSCKLRYDWGWPESDYSVDFFPPRIDVKKQWVEITTNYNGTTKKEGSRSDWNSVIDYINDGHHYKAKKGDLLLQGEVHYRENCDTTGSTTCVQTTDASWSIRLNRPKKQ